jgi:DNA repair protein RadC
VVAHNHPSGDPAPSAEDHAVTQRLKQAGELLGIRVVDHVIIGAESHYSLFEQREL